MKLGKIMIKLEVLLNLNENSHNITSLSILHDNLLCAR
jgi:hypothetical protein